jgi:hypothetical protein
MSNETDQSDLERIRLKLHDAARSKKKADGLPVKVSATHARILFELALGASVQEACALAGTSRRTGERLAASRAFQTVLREYRTFRYARALEAGADIAREAIGDAYATLAEAARSGSISAAKEIMKLAGVQAGAERGEASTKSIELPLHINIDYQEPTEQIRSHHTPTPPPLFLNSIRPQWTATLGQADVDGAPEDDEK